MNKKIYKKIALYCVKVCCFMDDVGNEKKIFFKHSFSHFAGVNVKIIIDIFSCFPII